MVVRLNDKVTASGQIQLADVPGIKAQGFTTVITVRPDGEMPGQPTHQAMKAEVEAAGLTHAFIPVIPGTVPSADDAKRFAALVEGGPVFAYCGSGPRVVLLASCAAAASGRPVEDVIAEARQAGFDLAGARGLLMQMAAAAG